MQRGPGSAQALYLLLAQISLEIRQRYCVRACSVTNESPHVTENLISLQTRNRCCVESEYFQLFTKIWWMRRFSQQNIVHPKKANKLKHGCAQITIKLADIGRLTTIWYQSKKFKRHGTTSIQGPSSKNVFRAGDRMGSQSMRICRSCIF